jgi:hypothetical protein
MNFFYKNKNIAGETQIQEIIQRKFFREDTRVPLFIGSVGQYEEVGAAEGVACGV